MDYHTPIPGNPDYTNTTCSNCQRRFNAMKASILYCSTECRTTQRSKLRHSALEERTEKCIFCFKSFQTKHKKKSYCSSQHQRYASTMRYLVNLREQYRKNDETQQ